MPEFTVKEVRVPELHLPEVKREDIVRTLSGARLPEIDLAKARRASIKIPSVSISGSDVGRLLAAGATIARVVRPTPSRRPWRMGPFARRRPSPIERIVQPKRRRSRRPLVIAVIAMVAIGAWAILRRPDVRRRIDLAIDDAKARMAGRRVDEDETGLAVREPVAVMASSPSTAMEGVTSPADDIASTPMGEAADAATESDGEMAVPNLEERASAG